MVAAVLTPGFVGLVSGAAGAAPSPSCVAQVEAAEAALRHDPQRLRLRHHIERVIQAWEQAEARCPPRARAVAAEGRAGALALLAHWSGRVDDQKKAEWAAARAKRVRRSSQDNDTWRVLPSATIAQIRAEMRAAHPDIVAQLEHLERPANSSRYEIKRIVLDPGHGGRDFGASGNDGLREKDINLALARRLARELEARLGLEVVLTRTSDRFVSLRERVQIAHRVRGDLFISIHANAHRSKDVHGIETYYAASSSVSDASKRLASSVQRALVLKLRNQQGGVRDLGVKRRRFHVLRASRMPSILIETGFVTHEREGRRLGTARYRSALAEAIADGVDHLSKRGNIGCSAEASKVIRRL